MAGSLREFYGDLSEGVMPLLDAGCPTLFPLFKKRGGGIVSLPLSISKFIASHQVS